MFQTIGEKIAVAGVYTQGHFLPKKFRWSGKEYRIQETTLVTDIRDGLVKKRMYSVRSGEDLYRLMFNRETEVWVLEEVWIE